jgi:hypothetical protein
MDAADPLVARGLPCAFERYEVQHGADWTPIKGGVPGRSERLRLLNGTAGDEATG